MTTRKAAAALWRVPQGRSLLCTRFGTYKLFRPLPLLSPIASPRPWKQRADDVKAYRLALPTTTTTTTTARGRPRLCAGGVADKGKQRWESRACEPPPSCLFSGEVRGVGEEVYTERGTSDTNTPERVLRARRSI